MKALRAEVKSRLLDMAVKLLARILSPEGFMKIAKIHYARLLKTFSEEQEQDLKIVRYFISAGGYVVDVGANIGVYTKFLSNWVGKTGLVYSIEPIPSTYDVLTSNIKYLHLDNVKPINCAISESNGRVIMDIPIDDRGLLDHYTASISTEPSLKPRYKKVRVTAKTLDSLLSHTLNSISLIKIDVEGHEFACIRGALETIEKWQPVLLVEILHDLNNQTAESFQLFNLLQSRGYWPWWFDGKNLCKWQIGDISVNYFFLTPKHVDTLRNKDILYSEEN